MGMGTDSVLGISKVLKAFQRGLEIILEKNMLKFSIPNLANDEGFSYILLP